MEWLCFVIRGVVISWMRPFSVLVTITTLPKFVFVEVVNSWERATHEYHEN